MEKEGFAGDASPGEVCGVEVMTYGDGESLPSVGPGAGQGNFEAV
jgi:hypothetical protein